LPLRPSLDAPSLHPEKALPRREDVLVVMLAAGDITPEQERAARRAPLGLHRGRLYTVIHEPSFFSYVREELNDRVGPAAVTSGGLQIRTTLVPRLQRLAKRAIATYFHHRYDPAAALVAIDPHTGAIKAMAAIAPGRRGLQFNLASQGHRQAGSAFKMF